MKFIFLLLQTVLIVIPIIIYKHAKNRYYEKLYFITGIATGLIISPFSYGLYGFYYIPYIGLIPGMIGLMLSLIIIEPLGMVDRYISFNIEGQLAIHTINGIIWAIILGVIGFIIDILRKQRKQKKELHNKALQ